MALIGEMQYLTIGGNTYSIPTSGGSTVTIERALTSGTKSATISVDGTNYDLYAPTGSGAINVENGQIKLNILSALSGGTDESVFLIAKGSTSGISGLYIGLDDGSVDGESLFIPDMNGVSTAYQQIINSIPTSVSQLTNDSGFITSYTETDPTVPSWAKASTKPTYTASEVGAIRGNVGGVFYGTCPTAAGTVEKAVTCAEFTADDLKAGTIIVVSFSATNSGAVANLKLNVNGTGAKPIKYINNGTLGNLSSAGYLKANVEYPFYYDGTNWVVWFNYNTTYSALSEADMQAGTATTARTITAARLKQAVEYHAPVKSVNGSTGDVTVTVPTKTSDLTNDSGFLTSAPVTSVNGQTGAVTVSVPTQTSELTNNSGYINSSELADAFATQTFYATDATSEAVLAQIGGRTPTIKKPVDIYAFGILSLSIALDPRTWFAWMNGTELELSRLSLSVDTTTSTATFYLRGRTSVAVGRVSLSDGTGDNSWTVTDILPIYDGGVS